MLRRNLGKEGLLFLLLVSRNVDVIARNFNEISVIRVGDDGLSVLVRMRRRVRMVMVNGLKLNTIYCLSSCGKCGWSGMMVRGKRLMG